MSYIAFMHPPKCAGSTIYALLSRFFHKVYTSHEHFPLPMEASDYGMISSHASFSKMNALAEEKVWLTVTRHPMSRLRSMFSFFNSFKNATIVDQGNVVPLIASKMKFTEFALSDNEDILAYVDNPMTRQLACVESGNINKSFSPINPKIIGESELELAKQRISNFNFIIRSSRFETDFMKMISCLGFQRYFSAENILKFNVTDINYKDNPGVFNSIPTDLFDNITLEDIERIHKRLRYDIKLFDYINEIIESNMLPEPSPNVLKALPIILPTLHGGICYHAPGSFLNTYAFLGDWSRLDDTLTWQVGGRSTFRAKIGRLETGESIFNMDVSMKFCKNDIYRDLLLENNKIGKMKVRFINPEKSFIAPLLAGDGMAFVNCLTNYTIQIPIESSDDLEIKFEICDCAINSRDNESQDTRNLSIEVKKVYLTERTPLRADPGSFDSAVRMTGLH